MTYVSVTAVSGREKLDWQPGKETPEPSRKQSVIVALMKDGVSHQTWAELANPKRSYPQICIGMYEVPKQEALNRIEKRAS